MKKVEIRKVPIDKIGRINKNGVKTEPSEDYTCVHLTQFGFNIELIRPSNTTKTNNPDVLMLGTIWEIKTLISNNETTIKNRFSKASKQAHKVIFDLRKVKNDSDKVEKFIVKLFKQPGNIDHIMIIRKNGQLLDFIK
ncbi:hypothetical protein IJH06_00915 [Candidatus Saccharibacteria bacterium]|nr:hypothetical protein [Candidatus Saccharibacteria bacterium]